MSHGDKIHALPPGLHTVGSTDNCEYAAVAGVVGSVPMFGLQFHPEVSHTPLGRDILRNFVVSICGAKQDWSMASFVDGESAAAAAAADSRLDYDATEPAVFAEAITSIRRAVGDGHVLGAVSGGVDSTVAAVLLHRAIGDRFHALMVDNGLLRKNEREQVVRRLRDECGVNLQAVDASAVFMAKLAGVADPETKRKIIGHTFIEVFEAEAAKLSGRVDYLLQGTLYPDVIESISFKGPSATIKSHHNVGGLLADMKLKLIEPLRELFKDEVCHGHQPATTVPPDDGADWSSFSCAHPQVRALGLQLGLPEDSVFRHPFPGPGLAIRILGEVSAVDHPLSPQPLSPCHSLSLCACAALAPCR